MTRVLLVGPLPPPAHGAAVVTAAVYSRLEPLDLDVSVVDTGLAADGIQYHRLRLLRHVQAVVSIARQRPGVVYVAGAGGLGLWYQAAVVAAACLFRSDVYFHHHSYAYLTRRRPVMRLLSALPTRHVALSDGMARELRTQYPRMRDVLVQSNAAYVDGGQQQHNSRAAATPEVRLIHVSNLSLAKGLGRVLAIYRRLVDEEGVLCTLTLVGPVMGPAEQELLSAWQGPPVRRTGALSRREVLAELSRHDIFVFPSNYVNEAQPLVVLEALACGLRVVCSPVGALPELVHGPFGCCLEDDDEFVERITSYASKRDSEEVRALRAERFQALASDDSLLTSLEASARSTPCDKT